MNLLSSSSQTANVNFPLRVRRSCQRRAVSNLLDDKFPENNTAIAQMCVILLCICATSSIFHVIYITSVSSAI